MSKEKIVTEVCPECGAENAISWDVEDAGYRAYCPHCGTPMLLCSECKDRCGWKDGRCRHVQPPVLAPPAAESKKIWGCLDIMFQLTEQEYQTLCEAGDEAKELIFRKMRSGAFLLDGETYFPQTEGVKEDCWPVETDIDLYL